MEKNQSSTKNYNKLIVVLSVLIPVAVALLYYVVPMLGFGTNNEFRVLAHINAIINSLTFITLLGALIAIKKKNIELHKKLILSSILLGGLFLVNYVILHSTTESVKYGGEGGIKILYLILLASHIILSIGVLPFVLVALARGLNGQIEMHRKIAKIAFPIWLYVTISGVIVYFLISPYY